MLSTNGAAEDRPAMRKTRGVWVVVLQMMNRAEAPDNGGGGGWRAGGPVQRRAWHRNTATDQTHARGRAGRAGFEQLDKERAHLRRRGRRVFPGRCPLCRTTLDGRVMRTKDGIKEKPPIHRSCCFLFARGEKASTRRHGGDTIGRFADFSRKKLESLSCMMLCRGQVGRDTQGVQTA